MRNRQMTDGETSRITGIPAVFADVSVHLQNFKKLKDAQLILDWVDFDRLNPSQKIHYMFLQGRIHALYYKKAKKITHLEKASACYDHLFEIARKYGQPITSARYYFAFIYSKYQLSQTHPCSKVKQRNARVAYNTLILAQYLIKGNSSMTWIAQKVNPTGSFSPTINLNAYWK